MSEGNSAGSFARRIFFNSHVDYDLCLVELEARAAYNRYCMYGT